MPGGLLCRWISSDSLKNGFELTLKTTPVTIIGFTYTLMNLKWNQEVTFGCLNLDVKS